MGRRAASLALVAACLGSHHSARGSASDPLSDSAPSFDSPRPEAQPYEIGEYSVSDRSGTVTYSIPIDVPPGRQGIAPSLALTYSSQAPIRGGVAAGWSLDVWRIRWDRATERFVAEMGPTVGPLVEVEDTSISGGVPYRLERDDTHARFEYLGKRGWIVYTTDGVWRRLGDSALTADGFQWLLGRVVDRFNNRATYHWTPYLDPATGLPFDHLLASIEYSDNETAGLAPHALVELVYEQLPETCPGSKVPKGARLDYSVASPEAPTPYLEGSHKLLFIRTYVRDSQLPRTPYRLVRQYGLGYDENAERCDTLQSPRRVLTSVAESAWDRAGAETRLPPTTFEYEPWNAQFSLVRTVPGDWGHWGAAGKLGADLRSTLLDMNGDGIAERVSVQRTADRCRLVAEPLVDGIGEGGVWDLPLMPWREGMPADGEDCSLDHQVTFRHNLDPASLCSQELNENLFSFLDWDGDGRTDLLTAILADDQFYDPNLEAESDLPQGAMPLCFKHVRPDLVKDPSHLGLCLSETRWRLQSSCGKFAWRFYRNTGTELEYVQTLWVPIPIVPDGRRGNLGHGKGAVASQNHAVLDLNGDRRMDLIWVAGQDLGCPEVSDASPVQHWGVYLGRGDGTFEDLTCWEVPNDPTDVRAVPRFSSGDGAFWTHRFAKTVSNLIDVNQDGLVDLVTDRATDPTTYVHMNHGAGFLPQGWPLSASPDPGLAIEEVDRSLIVTTAVLPGGSRRGTRRFIQRAVDFDHDGLTDLIFIPNAVDTQYLRLNMGDVLLEPVPISRDWLLAQRFTRKDVSSWRVENDLVDLTGDGRADLVTWDGANATIRSQDYPSGPPGLLRRVDNHRGLVIELEYASTLDRSVVAPDERLWELPQIMWVARRMIVTPAPGVAPSITDYRYAGPVYGSESGRASDPKRFLGFEHTYTDLPQAAGATGRGRIERRYEYAFAGSLQDRRGRLVEEWSFARDAAGGLALASYEKNEHAIEPLFDGRATFVHPMRSEMHVCGAGEPLTACMTSGANALHEIETWVPWPDAITPKLYLREELEQRQAPPSAPLTPGDRKHFSAREIRYGDALNPTLYFIAPQFEETSQAVSDVGGVTWQLSGRAITTNDPIYALPIQTDVSFDESTVASTVMEFDVRTGNLVRVTKPVQLATTGASSTYQYDDHELFAWRTTNELGHVVEQVTDVGTGVVTLTRGPNSKPIAGGFAREETRTRIDGFGRVVEEYVSLDDPIAGYASTLVARVEYQDFSIPNFVDTWRLREFGVPFWLRTRTTLDGLGRVVRTSKQRWPLLVEEVVSYRYDGAGNLDALITPDPRDDFGATVTTTLEYDAISRPIRLVRPDGTGLTRAYDGRVQTIREDTTDGSGATTVATYDKFGRLVQIDEIDATEVATTTYAYDGDGQLVEVMDADGNQTTLSHDWAGHRTSITRGARTWRYGWDLNGNLEIEIPPVPAGALEAEYTTRYLQDDLDRITQRIPATMGRSDFRRAELGIGTIAYFYDGAAGPTPNAIGRLSKVKHFVDDLRTSGREETVETEYTYLARGLVSQELRRVDASYLGDVAATQWVAREYNALDLPTRVTFDDGTTWKIGYDTRGLTSTVDWYDPVAAAYKRVAAFTSSLAGQVRERTTPLGAFGQRRTTTYDVLGRPEVDEIHDLSPLTLRARRHYTFNQSGDITTVDVADPSVAGSFSFAYDRRHRLRSASGPPGYTGSWTYSPAGNVLSAWVTGPVHPRAVTYQYGALDPQAVDALLNPDGTSYATFSYGPEGNMIQRSVPEGDWTLEWDNEDALREATGPAGMEAYWYDHGGSRTLALTTTGSRVWFGESETNIDSNGGERRWIHVAGLARVENGTTIELQYADHLQSTSLALDSSGAPTVSYVYAPWGEVLASSGATGTHRRRFNGKENDEKTGLNYYGFRYYDPLAQAWISGDPLYRFVPEAGLTDPKSLNLYQFSHANPVRYYDPDGRREDTYAGPFREDREKAAKEFDEAVKGQIEDCKKSNECVSLDSTPGKLFFGSLAVLSVLAVAPMVIGALSSGAGAGVAVGAEAGAGAGSGLGGGLGAGAGGGIGAGLLAEEGVGVGGGGAAPRIVFRNGPPTPSNLTPRPGVDTTGLSTFDSLEAATAPGGKATVIDTTKLSTLRAVPDAPPPGHVSISPGSSAALSQWAATRGTTVVHQYTQELLEAVVEVIKRPR